MRPLSWILLVVGLWLLAVVLAPGTTFARENSYLVGAVALAAAAVVFAGWWTRRVYQRLRGLEEMAAGLRHGDFSARADESGSDVVARLSTAMNRMALRTERVIGDLEARDRSLHFVSNHDTLTGLPNRRLFQELLNKDLDSARRSDERVAVLLVDLDSFKTYNDSYGTAFGDRLLVAVADRISTHLREADLVSRLGGDEFALALPKAQSVEGLLVATRRLLEGLQEPFPIEAHEVLISVSIGVGLYPDSGETSDELLSRASEALRLAKDQGGNSFRVFDADLSWARAHLALEQDLRHALRGAGLCVHYQPQVSLDDGRIIGLEALVRWPHPEQGLLSAGVFVPMAEATGLMPALGSWLAGEICRQIAVWDRAGLARCPVSVNVSARQFQAGNLVEVIEYVLARHDLAPDRLQLEVTESIAMHDIEQVNEALSRLRGLGIRIHLDDFGTGFSSLSFLLKHPVDVLKIDRSFVAGITLSEHSEAIVRATISLSQSLDLSLIAEGIETPGQLAFLRRHGCEAGQGYLLARPVPVPEVEALLRRGSVDLPAG